MVRSRPSELGKTAVSKKRSMAQINERPLTVCATRALPIVLGDGNTLLAVAALIESASFVAICQNCIDGSNVEVPPLLTTRSLVRHQVGTQPLVATVLSISVGKPWPLIVTGPW